jgi:hypothetical protein
MFYYAAFIPWFEEDFDALVKLWRLIFVKLERLCEMMPKYVVGMDDSWAFFYYFSQFQSNITMFHCSRTLVASRPDQLKPSPIAARKVYDKQESTSPRLARRTTNLAQGNLLGKPGSM